MLASLLTPVRNASAYLPECAASVVAQTHDGPLEWCVFDDGSSDDTLALLDAEAAGGGALSGAALALVRRALRRQLTPPR